MKKIYIKPTTGVIANAIDVPILAGSDDGNHHTAKQNIYIIDIDEESSDYRNIQWPQPKSLWND